MEDCNELKFVSVDKDYLDELERRAKKSEWQRGYVEGFNDAICHAERILRAARGSEE